MLSQKIEYYINSHKRGIEKLAIVCPLVVLFSYFFFIVKYSINFPFYDDFHSILEFIEVYNNQQFLYDKLCLLFKQHNEHRIVFDRVIVLLQYKMFNIINFKSLILLGNIALVFIIGVLYKAASNKNELNFFYLIPVSLLVLNFSYYEVSFWAMASLQNIWVLAFALLSLWFLYKDKGYTIYLSVLLALIATYTSGNGLMTFVAGTFVLLLNKRFFNYKTIIWVLSGVLVICLYFHGYIKPAYHPSVWRTLVEHPLNFIVYIFTFLGGSFNIPIGFVTGLVLVLFICFITFKKYYLTNPTLYSFAFFLILTSIAVALGRAGFGIQQSTDSRYMINSSVFLVVCYLVFISIFNKNLKPYHYLFFILISLSFHFYSYRYLISYQINYKKQFDKNYALITTGKVSNFNFGWPPKDKSEAKKILKKSNELGIFMFSYKENPVNKNNE